MLMEPPTFHPLIPLQISPSGSLVLLTISCTIPESAYMLIQVNFDARGSEL